VLIALFTVEQIVNGIVNGFDHYEPPSIDHGVPLIETRGGQGIQP